MLCSIFRSLFWAQTIATKVKYGFFHLRDGVDSQNVSAFGPFGIWVFCVRDAQPAQTCFLQCVLRVHIPWPASQTVWRPPTSRPVCRWLGVSQFSEQHSSLSSSPGKSAGRKHWVFSASYGLLLISWISSFSLLSPVTRGHWCSIS